MITAAQDQAIRTKAYNVNILVILFAVYAMRQKKQFFIC